MKKLLVPWLALVAILIIGSLIVIHFKTKPGYFRQAGAGEEGVATPKSGALFADSVVTEGFEIGATGKYKNLQVFILVGNGAGINQTYTTLQSALSAKMVTVIETGNVNELKIDNHSASFIYINSGDIVKGGQQDRTIQYDVIIPPYKTGVDLASFCVEHGRWTQRENEEVTSFARSEASLSSKELKIAAKHAKSQQQVWEKVSKYQSKANEELNKATPADSIVDVKSAVSESSLQLTLDNDQLKAAKEACRSQLSLLKNTKNAWGLAYYINGKLYGVDVYNNPQLFADLFDKLLDAAILEAISVAVNTKDALPFPDVNKVLAAPAMVYEDLDVNEATRFQSSEAARYKDLVIFTTFDKAKNKWLHRSWVDKTED